MRRRADIEVEIGRRSDVRLWNGRFFGGATIFTVSLKPGSCAANFEIRPRVKRVIEPVLGAALALGVVTGAHRARQGLEVCKASIRASRSIPAGLRDIGALYRRRATRATSGAEPSAAGGAA